jgi:hypothetical protein
MNAEKRDPTASVWLAHLSELYVSPRHAALSSALRAEQLQLLVCESLRAVYERWPRDGRDPLPRPQLTRASNESGARPWPEMRNLVAPVASTAPPLPGSALHAVRLVPAAGHGEGQAQPDQVQHALLCLEGVEVLRAVLAQLPQQSVAIDRLLLEQGLLIAAAAKEHRKAAAQLDIGQQPQWAAMAQKALRSPHLHDQLVAATAEVERVAAALNAHLPGQAFGVEHELVHLGAIVLEQYPEVATLLQMLWCLKPINDARGGRPLGRLRQALPNLRGTSRASAQPPALQKALARSLSCAEPCAVAE